MLRLSKKSRTAESVDSKVTADDNNRTESNYRGDKDKKELLSALTEYFDKLKNTYEVENAESVDNKRDTSKDCTACKEKRKNKDKIH